MSHSHHPGRGGKTDATDVGKDHSPQDEIVLYGIQANVTTIATTHTTVNTNEASTYDELLIDVINYGTIGDTHPEKIVVDDICALHGAMKHIQQYSCLQVPAVRGQPHFMSRLTLELEAMCYPSAYSNISTQTGSGQMACPLAWITSASG